VVGLSLVVILLAVYAVFRRTSAPPAQPAPPAPKTQPANPVLATPTGEMVLVPGGNFLYGEVKTSVWLPGFYIDRSPVTNAAYAGFCEAASRPLPRGFPKDHPNDPVSNITIIEAQSFARWAGKRLPRAQEWEKAAGQGAFKVAGAVAEFVDELREPTPESVKYFSEVLHLPTVHGEPWYAIRGGSGRVPLRVPARYKSVDIGFRCVKSP
jgi:serine/threonine-protein kinase